ncbi:SusC/RagA family TonB-linked outer membrane protein [Sphingobacterium sp. SGR-19]|uniref:SusC/RagA family TonB-linked outer membrane protein n=1 Tax=Sphingobacterium sp. SGR-19 TaxID=2710886 RepID=UPI0013EBA267|nr:TonB-dependent receptor [Sphingobacterium sp. SGR-19]NGM64414.1 TonB-dependent receptor [Sphingobacterium sp. SGR-19]
MDKFLSLTYTYMRIFTVINVLLVAAATCLQAAPGRAQTLEKRVSVSFSNMSLHEAVLDLQRRSGAEFAFTDELGLYDLSVGQADFTNERLSVILKTMMAGHNITFFERDGIVFLTEAQQPRSIRGRVTNLRREPLAGATVAVKDRSGQMTTTDSDGRYRLAVTGNPEILVVSFMGYQTKEVAIANRMAIEIQLEDALRSLNEVVVVGYGTQKKENLTGSISSLKGEELINRPIIRASAALQGLAPGLTVTQQSGRPGADGGSLRVRGIGTLGDASPLVLIDGIEGAIDGVDPNDIASISVLKDAASASIYGSRAANGVILVTTKQGKGENLQVNYNNYIGWQRFTELPEYTDGYTYMVKLNEAYENMGRDPLYSEDYLAEYLEHKETDPDHYPDVDWQKEVYSGSGFTQSHYLSVSGGEKVNVMGSMGYQKQEGLIPGYDAQRYSFRFNAKMKISDRLQASLLLNGRYAPTDIAANDGNVIINVNRLPAIYASRYTDGRWAAGMNGFNSLAQVTEGGFDRTIYGFLRPTLQLNYQPLKGLDLEMNYTPQFSSTESKRFVNAVETYEVDSQTPTFIVPARAYLEQSYRKTWENTFRLLARYQRRLGKHQLGAVAGYEQIAYQANNFGAKREGYPFPQYTELNAGSVEFMTNSGTAAEWSLRSGFGRMNYSFADKYLLEANLRIDGSSRFAQGQKWGTFPSFSAGWLLSNEPFMQSVSFFNTLKLRASWGMLGNQLIGNYPAASVVNLGQSYVNGGAPLDGAAQLAMANEEITWESTTSSNVGIDMTFLNNSFDLSFDYYLRKTDDILLELPIPATIGLTAPYQNAGKVENRGWDLSLSYQQAYARFNHQVKLNLSNVANKVLDLRGAGPIIGSYTVNQEGYPINALYGYRALGLFQNEAEVETAPQHIGIYAPGDIRYDDVSGDGAIGPDDRVIIGNIIPRYTFGLNYRAQYKGFDMSFLIQGVGKADVMLARDAAWAFFNAGKINTWQLDAWRPDNPDAAYPRLIADRTHNNFQNSSYWVYNAAYARLKNLQLGYTFPANWANRIKANRIRIFASGDNLFTLHDMPPGWDPERPNGDATNYPVTATYSFGVNITF